MIIDSIADSGNCRNSDANDGSNNSINVDNLSGLNDSDEYSDLTKSGRGGGERIIIGGGAGTEHTIVGGEAAASGEGVLSSTSITVLYLGGGRLSKSLYDGGSSLWAAAMVASDV